MTGSIVKRLKNVLRKTPFFISLKKGYYFARRTVRKLYNIVFPTAIILLYHRVAESENDVNQLSVSPINFEDQLVFLSNKFKIISLKELANNLKQIG